MGSFHTPGTKKKSKQLMQKDQPGPIKAPVQASRTKHMVFVFFNNKGFKYTNYLLRDTIVNAIYILGSLTMFLHHFKKIRPEMLCRYWVFHWDSESVHTAVVVREFMAKKSIQLIDHPLYSFDLVPSDFTLFPKI